MSNSNLDPSNRSQPFGTDMSHIKSSTSRPMQSNREHSTEHKNYNSYELTRGEDLKRQIREKERELDSITQNRNNIRLKMVQNSMLSQIPEAPSHSHQQSYASHFPHQSYIQESQPQMRTIASPSRANFQAHSSQHDFSRMDHTAQHRSFNVTQGTNFQRISHSDNARQSSQDRTHTFLSQQQENHQLQRRLALVTQELERVREERQVAENALVHLTSETTELTARIQFEEKDHSAQAHLNEQMRQESDQHDMLQGRVRHAESLCREAAEVVQRLVTERGFGTARNQELEQGLLEKHNQIDFVQDQLSHAQHSVEKKQQTIEHLDSQLLADNASCQHMAALIDRLHDDKSQLTDKYLNLENLYEKTCVETSREKVIIQHNHQVHRQLLSTQVFADFLGICQKRQKQLAFNSVKLYSQFDRDCHTKLKQLARILVQIAMHRQKTAVKHWFTTALVPLKKRRQSELLAQKFAEEKLMRRCLVQIKLAHYLHKEEQGQKLKSAKEIWRIKSRDLLVEVKRALQIWKDKMKAQKLKELSLSNVLRGRYQRATRHSFHCWLTFSAQWRDHVKQHLLTARVRNKQLKAIVFGQLKLSTSVRSARKKSKLAMLFKAWKDQERKEKYIADADTLTFQLMSACRLLVLQECFNAVRLHKESEKLQLFQTKMSSDVVPSSSQLRLDLADGSVKQMKDRKERAFHILGKCANMMIQSYLQHWAEQVFKWRYRLHHRAKEVITRAYKQRVHSAYGLWMRGVGITKVTNQAFAKNRELIQNLQLNSQNTLALQSIECEQDRICRAGKHALIKAAKIYQRKVLQYGLEKWAAKTRLWVSQEQKGSSLVLFYMRRNLVRQGFQNLLAVATKLKLMELSEKRALDFRRTIQTRTKRRSFNAFCQYFAQFSRGKRTLGVLFCNMDLWLQKRTFYRWIEQGGVKVVQIAKEDQNCQTAQFQVINESLGKVVSVWTAKSAENSKLDKQFKSQARRILSNYFARFYYTKAQRGFSKWLDFSANRKHRNRVLLSALFKWRQNWNFRMKRALEKWKQRDKAFKLRLDSQTKSVQISDGEQLIKFNKDSHRDFCVKNIAQVQVERESEKVLSQQVQSSKLVIEHTAQNFVNFPKPRVYLQAWRKYLKNRNLAMENLFDAVTKIATQAAFNRINNAARQDLTNYRKTRCIEGMVRIHARKRMQFAFNNMRASNFANTMSELHSIENQTEEEVDEQNEFYKRTVAHNCEVQFERLQKQHKSDLFKAWHVVHSWKHNCEHQTFAHRELSLMLRTKREILRWRQRTEATIRARYLVNKMRVKSQYILAKMAMRGILQLRANRIRFCTLLSDMAAKYDNLMKTRSFENIRLQAWDSNRQKRFAKKLGAYKMMTNLRGLVLRRMMQQFSDLRNRVTKKHRKELVFKSMIGNCLAWRHRQAFWTWARQSGKDFCQQEVNEVGPVVKEVQHEQLRHENLKHFMRDEAYTNNEIECASDWAAQRSTELLARAVTRLQHKLDGKDILSRLFDRWRMFIKLRKLVKFLLNKITNHLSPKKADMSLAFRRWHQAVFNNDRRQTRDYLVAKAAKRQESAISMLNANDEAESFREQLQMQRDELIEKYIGGQRLAIACGREQIEGAQRKAVKMLSDYSYRVRNNQITAALQKNLDLIQQLKSKIAAQEDDNETVASENEELRSFTLNGYQIAKNMQNLQTEREQLSVDLADKAQVVKELLDRNEFLHSQLRSVLSR